MELKDRAYLKNKLKDEYDQICKTEFWRDYTARLEDERKLASRHCETDLMEDIPRYQGFVKAIDTVKGLPSKILDVAPKKS